MFVLAVLGGVLIMLMSDNTKGAITSVGVLMLLVVVKILESRVGPSKIPKSSDNAI